MNKHIQEFMDFVRTQGVVGLAVGIIIGGAVAKLVSATITDLVNPIIGIFLGRLGNLNNLSIQILSARILVGSFISSLIDFSTIALVVYFGVKKLRLDKLDKPKQ